MPNFNFKSQFPIAEVIAAAQRKPMMEAQLKQADEQMKQDRLRSLLDALSTGAQFARTVSSLKNEAVARDQAKSQAEGQQKLQQEMLAPQPTAPVAAPIQQFQRAAGPTAQDGTGPAPVASGATAQPTFGGTEYGAQQPQRLQAALLQAFPQEAGAQLAQQQFRNPLDDEYKKAQIANVGVDNQIAAARLLEDKRKNDFGIEMDKARFEMDREKLGLEREKLKLQAAEAGTKLTDVQANALLFGERAAQSSQELEQAIAGGFDPASMGTTLQRWLPNRLQGDQVQLLEQSKMNFVSAVLRKESGAAISPQEWKMASAQYFPKDGDSQKVLDQKKKNRETAIAGLLRQGGKQGQAIMDQYRSATAATDKGGGFKAVGSEAEALALPVGSKFQLPDGRTGTVQP